MSEEIYRVSGVRHSFKVVKMSDTKYRVHKETLKNNKLVKSYAYGSELSAKRDADRMARAEGSLI